MNYGLGMNWGSQDYKNGYDGEWKDSNNGYDGEWNSWGEWNQNQSWAGSNPNANANVFDSGLTFKLETMSKLSAQFQKKTLPHPSKTVLQQMQADGILQTDEILRGLYGYALEIGFGIGGTGSTKLGKSDLELDVPSASMELMDLIQGLVDSAGDSDSKGSSSLNDSFLYRLPELLLKK